MNNLVPIVQNFGIKPLNIFKRKYYYVINTAHGSYMLSVARPSKEKLESINEYKNIISSNGFYNMDSYIIAKDGKPYTEYENNVYILSKYYGENELEITNTIQTSVALETISKLHYAIKSAAEPRVYAAELDNPLIKMYEKQIAALKKARKNISRKSDFDIKLSVYIPRILERAEKVFNNLRLLNYGDELTICHNSLKEGNIIYNRGRCYIIDWDNMKMAHYLEDTAFFIKRCIRKSKTAGTGCTQLEPLWQKYSRFNKLTQREQDIFGELMDYPHRFITLILEYSKKNRGFVPSGLRNKIDECAIQWG